MYSAEPDQFDIKRGGPRQMDRTSASCLDTSAERI
jgi:hypothetical protein